MDVLDAKVGLTTPTTPFGQSSAISDNIIELCSEDTETVAPSHMVLRRPTFRCDLARGYPGLIQFPILRGLFLFLQRLSGRLVVRAESVF